MPELTDLGGNFTLFRYEYSIDISPDMKIKAARIRIMSRGELSEEQRCVGAVCKELLGCIGLDGRYNNGLDRDENQAILSTNMLPLNYRLHFYFIFFSPNVLLFSRCTIMSTK